MKIVIVTDAWGQTNGVVTTLTQTQRELHRQGHEALIIGPGEFRCIPSPDPDVQLAIPLGLSRRLDREQPDALHIAVEGPLGWTARHWALKRKVPFTTSYHTKWPEYLKKRYRIPEALTYRLMRHFHKPAAVTLFNSKGTEADLLRHGFNHLAEWGRGVDLELFTPDRRQPLPYEAPVLLSVGRLADEKNLEAFLSLDVPGTKLVVGDGPSRARLEQQFPHAVFVGKKTGIDLAQAYASADVFVFPSKTDTFGLVCLEAQASGVPIVSYPEPGPKVILQGASKPVGIMSDNLHEGVTRMLNHIAKGEVTPADCRTQAEKMGWQHPTQQLLSHLHRIDWSNR